MILSKTASTTSYLPLSSRYHLVITWSFLMTWMRWSDPPTSVRAIVGPLNSGMPNENTISFAAITSSLWLAHGFGDELFAAGPGLLQTVVPRRRSTICKACRQNLFKPYRVLRGAECSISTDHYLVAAEVAFSSPKLRVPDLVSRPLVREITLKSHP